MSRTARPTPPPSGWCARPASGPRRPRRGRGAGTAARLDRPGQEASPFPDLSALLGLVETARGALPPELARQLADALRELLIALRAVLDYSIDRLERTPRTEPEVEDIPIR